MKCNRKHVAHLNAARNLRLSYKIERPSKNSDCKRCEQSKTLTEFFEWNVRKCPNINKCLEKFNWLFCFIWKRNLYFETLSHVNTVFDPCGKTWNIFVRSKITLFFMTAKCCDCHKLNTVQHRGNVYAFHQVRWKQLHATTHFFRREKLKSFLATCAVCVKLKAGKSWRRTCVSQPEICV